jgi:RNA polymerase sigma-70 factor (ECF subfamily)
MTTLNDDFADDRALAKAVLAGDERAFRHFFDEHYDRLYRFLLPLLDASHEAAEDVVQQTMSRALSRLHTFRGDARLFTWMCRIGRNQAIDWQRANRRHTDGVISLDASASFRRQVEATSGPSGNSPTDEIDRDQVRTSVHETLDLLPAKYGDVLEWKYIHGLTSKEISERMDIGVEAVNSTLARAKRAFRDVFPDAGEGLRRNEQ